MNEMKLYEIFYPMIIDVKYYDNFIKITLTILTHNK